MKYFVLAIAALLAVAIAAPQAEAHGRRGRVAGFGFAPHHHAPAGSFGFHANNFGFHGQNFGARPRVNGFNSFASPGGRALVFVGFDRFGNPVFR